MVVDSVSPARRLLRRLDLPLRPRGRHTMIVQWALCALRRRLVVAVLVSLVEQQIPPCNVVVAAARAVILWN